MRKVIRRWQSAISTPRSSWSFVAREAQDAGLAVTELHTSWLDTLPEEAVIEARVEIEQEAARSEQVNDAVDKILDVLRSNGCELALRIEDVEIHSPE